MSPRWSDYGGSFQFRARARLLAIASLCIGGLLAVGFFAVAVVTPIIHPTTPFLIDLPGIATPLAPSVQLMAWIEAGERFLDRLFFGFGLGTDPIAIAYVAPSGMRHVLTDAHTVYLNIAMHSGSFALATILLLIGFVAYQMRPVRLTQASLLRLGLGFAWLNAFAY